MSSTQRLELEIGLLEKKKTALDSDFQYKERQYDTGMPTEPEMRDNDVATLVMTQLIRDRDRLDVEIAEKKLELYDLQGSMT